MIARLRARHRRMWIALVVVAPAVLAAALSVRRGEAEKQSLPGHLRDEGVADLEPGALPVAGIQWSRDGSGRRLMDLSLGPGPWLLGLPDVLVYWNPESPRVAAAEIAELPAGSVLLGALGTGMSHRFVVPDAVREGEGSLALFSMAHQSGMLLPVPQAMPQSRSPPR